MPNTSPAIKETPLFHTLSNNQKHGIITSMLDVLRAYTSGGSFKQYSDDLIMVALETADFENSHTEESLKSYLSLEKITILYRLRKTLPESLKIALKKYIDNFPEYDESREKQPIKTQDIHDYVKLMVNCAIRDWFKVEKNDILVFNPLWLESITSVSKNPLLNTELSKFWKKESFVQSDMKFKSKIVNLDEFEDSWLNNPAFLQLYTVIKDDLPGTIYMSDIFLLVLKQPNLGRIILDKLQDLFYSMWDKSDISEQFNQVMG